MKVNYSTLVELVRELITRITKHHSAIQLSATEMNRGIMFTLEVHSDDHGRVIGTHGANIKAIKAILDDIGDRIGLSLRILVKDPTKGLKLPSEKFKNNPSWPEESITQLVNHLCTMVFGGNVEVKLLDVVDATIYRIITDETEPKYWVQSPQPLRSIVEKSAFETILHAIGRANGRLIFADIGPRREGESRAIRPSQLPRGK